MSREQRQQLAEAAILAMVEQFGEVVTRRLLEAMVRVMAMQHAQQFHGQGVSPRDASYRIADLTGMSVRNARRYADAVQEAAQK